MDRETKIRWVLLLSAAAVTAAVLIGLYTARPIAFYQVTVSASSQALPETSEGAASAETAVSSGSDGAPQETPEEPDPAGPQEVLVEKSVNLNTATLEELDQLPGIGPSLGQRIIDYREANNGFYDIEEIMEVSGIGEKTFAKLEPYLTVE